MSKPPLIKGILFDFDGTLAQTMESHYRAWKFSLSHYGVSLKEEEYYPLEGSSLLDIATYFCKLYHLNFSYIPIIIEHKKTYFIKNNVSALYPGVKSILKKLGDKKILLGLVTASVSEQLQHSVSAEILTYFNVIVTGNKTSRGKPFPDPYLKGLEELQLPSYECLAVENAPLGIESAKRAGLYCIAISSTMDKTKLTKADEVISSFMEIENLPIIEKIMNKN